MSRMNFSHFVSLTRLKSQILPALLKRPDIAANTIFTKDYQYIWLMTKTTPFTAG